MIICTCEDCAWYQDGDCCCPDARIIDGTCVEYGPEEEDGE